jgi:branched-chain amino acid transport system ATP-binding protein
MTALLEARGIACGYNKVAVVRDVDIAVGPGQVVALLGPNGAGKTTTLRTLAGELPLLAGELIVDGESTKASAVRRARGGMAFVTEERSVFMRLSTLDNLRVAGVDVDRVLDLFPELEARLKIRAGLLSGGEQQMLTLGRAIARNPRLLLADELSLGLAPLVVRRLLETIRAAADDGLGVVLVEQQVGRALEIADDAHVMRRGSIALSGRASDLRERIADIESQYLSNAAVDDVAVAASDLSKAI